MTIQLRYRSAEGETRPWTLKEIVQGKPLGHPSHAMLIHFPLAFYFASVGLDLLTRLHADPALTRVSTYLLLGAFGVTLAAVSTGLVDWFGMAPGSKKRHTATLHMLWQLTTAGFFVVDFALRWSHRTAPHASWAWIGVGLAGLVTLTIGQYLGGKLVYEMGMRVSTVKYRERVEQEYEERRAG